MTEHPQPRLVCDLPPAHAAVLSRIHDLARRAAVLRRETYHSPELAQLDRDRSIAEIEAAASGIPPVWITQARESGSQGRAWRPSTVLRDPPKHRVVRRGYGRVVADTALLGEMAAVSVVREHHHRVLGIDTEPELAALDQFRRNMHALRARVMHTAETLKIGPAQRERAWTVNDGALAEHVHAHIHLPSEELTTRWRDLATPATAASVRSSIPHRRPADTAADPATQPPAIRELLDRARTHLPNVPAGTTRDGYSIEAAVHAALHLEAHEPEHTATDPDLPRLDHPHYPHLAPGD